MSEISLTTYAAADTMSIAQRLGQACSGGEVFLLVGPLGAGKTSFVQGLAWGLGVEGYTHSPTFVLAVEYHGKATAQRPALVLYHLDLYRIESSAEAIDIGLEEYLSSGGITAIEWADRAMDALSSAGLLVTIGYLGEGRRRIRFQPMDAQHQVLLDAAMAQFEGQARRTEHT